MHTVLDTHRGGLPMGVVHPLEKGGNLRLPPQKTTPDEEVVDALKPGKVRMGKEQNEGQLVQLAPSIATHEKSPRFLTILIKWV